MNNAMLVQESQAGQQRSQNLQSLTQPIGDAVRPGQSFNRAFFRSGQPICFFLLFYSFMCWLVSLSQDCFKVYDSTLD